jgi:hypothetical protein
VKRKGVNLSKSQRRGRILAEQLRVFQNCVASCNILATYFSLKPLLEPTQGIKKNQIVRRESPVPSAVLTLIPSSPTAALWAKRNCTQNKWIRFKALHQR